MKVFVVMGTRPEAVKMAPIVHQLMAYPQDVETIVCATGQHREMLDQVLTLFGIQPDIDLNLMQQNQTPSQVAARVLLALDPILAEIRPDWLLVQGDTTTVMAASIAAHHRQVRVGHVEAGLRTYDRANPFPEEMNRVVADHVSDLHFAPTPRACENLLAEGISSQSIHVTGNTVIDALLWVAEQPLSTAVQTELSQYGLDKFLEGEERNIILVTAHRRENHGRPIQEICHALRTLAQTWPQLQIVYPVHRNPNIWNPVHELLGNVPGITLLPPVDYALLTHLMKHSRLILTDSGGIQEEAPSLGVPVLVLRETTERPEAVEAGAAKVVGTDADHIVKTANHLLGDTAAYQAMAQAVNPYGDGQAARRMVEVLLTGQCTPFVTSGRN
jgi:UDP-N-acetylglucosamine 2-epimerase (non-hydrolysing)